jgi:hypothetical protein
MDRERKLEMAERLDAAIMQELVSRVVVGEYSSDTPEPVRRILDAALSGSLGGTNGGTDSAEE